MVKQHNIKLNIQNNTSFTMTYHSDYFESGRLADSFSWPKVINTSGQDTVLCYERDWSFAGCSGFVQFNMNGSVVTIAFSNPLVGCNKLNVGAGYNGIAVWEEMSNHDYQEFKINLKVGEVPITATCKCSFDTTNNASVIFH
ncbi:uncharacterized protein LOC130647085 [Hydractinia symbiolongicarpus]|uniref:uncharacterized protein LOC130647085 n=1 Tax=Hydractinia symbiolongicarpus TaxID=13093 RepID=UPI00254FAFF1|nr:uncharacterized protein LOC130647085 [Hydractinia symbiolongicarpus]